MERLQQLADHPQEKEAELRERMRKERDEEFAEALRLQAKRLDQVLAFGDRISASLITCGSLISASRTDGDQAAARESIVT